MKVFIAGATGVLGRRLIRQFRARGHEVIGLVRSPKGERIVQSLGGASCWGDLFNSDSLARFADGAEAVIHAATAIPVKTKPSAKDWAMNDRIRRDGTRALADCAARIGAKLFLLQSIVWVARPADGSPFDEDSPPNPDAITQSTVDMERVAREAGERGNFRVATLRCGYFYDPDSAHIRLFGELLARRKLPIIGRGDAVMAILHTDDAAGAFVTAAEAGKAGLWHVVDNELVTVKDFLSTFAERLGAPRPRRVPVWLARLLAGESAVRYFTSSTRTSNARFRQDFDWHPCYPSFHEGLAEIVATWKEEGFLAGAGKGK